MEYLVIVTSPEDAASRAELAQLAPRTRFTLPVQGEDCSIVFVGARGDALVFRSLYREEIVRFLAKRVLERDYGCRDVLVQKVLAAGRIGGPAGGNVNVSALSLLTH
jgi:hypothetical protein